MDDLAAWCEQLVYKKIVIIRIYNSAYNQTRLNTGLVKGGLQSELRYYRSYELNALDTSKFVNIHEWKRNTKSANIYMESKIWETTVTRLFINMLWRKGSLVLV